MAALQVWGGAECTVSRTAAGYSDQTILSGHDVRPDDLDRFAALGLMAIRYPILWERVTPDAAGPDWTWTDARLHRLRDLGIRPIAGLVHHGSGPSYTDLLDDGFASGLGRYAGQVARRYPWIEDWTPVNEPLTTARFSALYGHWYPHARDEGAFWRALLNQIDGTRAAMHAIRRVNLTARLIQTDDLGRTYATTTLGEQAAFDNLRRWIGWDLLFGRVTPHHPLWQRIAAFGLADRLRGIADDPCPPDILGINHYLTSDRFLDHRLQRYPMATHGGNGRRSYADVEAVRVLDPPPAGLAGALREAWQRYATPIAVTEVHNGCTREEQLRWAAEAWDTAQALRGDGVDIRAVTAWSLLGSHGWDTLLTRPGRYETGVFDVASGTPRATALAELWRGLPQGAARHPVARQPGWWRRPERLLYPSLARPSGALGGEARDDTPPLLICGATGMLGREVVRACRRRGIAYRATTRGDLDLTRTADIALALDRIRPWGVINAAGWASVDAAEDADAACHAINATGAIALAQACATRGIASVHVSSALVFDGTHAGPYVETDRPAPLSAHGRSKAAMEAGCVGLSGALVIRAGYILSPDDPKGFAAAVAEALDAGRRFRAADDHHVTPIGAAALVDAMLDLLIDRTEGLCHLAGSESVTWAGLARRVAHALRYDRARIEAVPAAALGWRAPRPKNGMLASLHHATLGTLDAQIDRIARQREAMLARRWAA